MSTTTILHYKLTGKLMSILLREKERLIDKLESKLNEKEKREALSDGHAKREPRPCGMTIHTGIGCSFGCVYCYVPDMGFPMKPRPYPLTGEQLVYALASNPYFLPGPLGTLLAFGSVTEPFMPETFERAIEYLRAVKTYLGNPTQLSTKAFIDEELAKEIRSSIEPYASILVTIITIKYAQKLEPGAPSPQERLTTIHNLTKQGLHVTLFLRPIIPSITEQEVLQIIEQAYKHGARGVVPGSLRVTPGIIRRLELVGIDVKKIMTRLPRMPRDKHDQVTIKEKDLKDVVKQIASKYPKLKVYASSCAANIDAHGLGCYACKWGPCGDQRRIPYVDEQGVIDALEVLGLKPRNVSVSKNKVTIWLSSHRGVKNRLKIRQVKHYLVALSKREVIVKASPGP